MRRRSFLAAVTVTSALAIALPALAQSTVESVVNQLQRQGFDVTSVRKTLLGRSRILAESPDGRREVVINPRSGEVLRDFFYARDDKDDNDRDRDDDDDDRDDDDGDRDDDDDDRDDDDDDRDDDDDDRDDDDDDRDDDDDDRDDDDDD